MANRRRDTVIDQLPDELRLMVRGMLGSKYPRFTYDQIIDAVQQKAAALQALAAQGKYEWPVNNWGEPVTTELSRSALSRYYSRHLVHELEEVERQARFTTDLAQKVAETVGNVGDNPEYMQTMIESVIDAAFLASETGPQAVAPDRLLEAKARLVRADVARHELQLKERRLDMQREQWKLKAKKMEAELEAQKRAEERRKKDAEQALQAAERAPLGQDEATRTALAAIRKALGIEREAAA